MKHEELIRIAKTANSPEDLVKLAKSAGVGNITADTAAKLYSGLRSSHELADEELDVSAGGCFLFNGVVCPNCHQVVGFELLGSDGVNMTAKCEGCGNTASIPMSSLPK